MDVKTGLFYVFATVLLLAAFRVITTRNPVHAVLFLVLAFFQASMIWMLLEAEFLAITLVLVYVGCRDGAVPVCGDDARHQSGRCPPGVLEALSHWLPWSVWSSLWKCPRS